MTGQQFEILFVCHANLCRSPLAERLARKAFDDAFGAAGAQVVTSSAGTHAHEGTSMHSGSARVLSERGIDSGGFTSRRLNESILMSADLVLTAARSQRAACATMAPAITRRTFTVRQFTRFTTEAPQFAVSGDPTQRLQSLLTQIASMRHLVPPVSADADDLPDPVGQPVEEFRFCADELWRTMRLVTDVITAS